jgi:hypothetical protein
MPVPDVMSRISHHFFHSSFKLSYLFTFEFVLHLPYTTTTVTRTKLASRVNVLFLTQI